MFEPQDYQERRPQGDPQRRQCNRARVDLPMFFSIVGETAWRDACLSDLSGGGIRMSSATDLRPVTALMLGFEVPEAREKIITSGRVVMSFFDGATQHYSHGVAFTRIAPAAQEIIVNYVNDALLLNRCLTASS